MSEKEKKTRRISEDHYCEVNIKFSQEYLYLAHEVTGIYDLGQSFAYLYKRLVRPIQIMLNEPVPTNMLPSVMPRDSDWDVEGVVIPMGGFVGITVTNGDVLNGFSLYFYNYVAARAFMFTAARYNAAVKDRVSDYGFDVVIVTFKRFLTKREINNISPYSLQRATDEIESFKESIKTGTLDIPPPA